MHEHSVRDAEQESSILSWVDKLKSQILVHYIICAMGLIAISQRVGCFIGDRLSAHYYSGIDYNTWAHLATTNGKLSQLLAYALTVMSLFLYFELIVIRYLRDKKLNKRTLSDYKISLADYIVWHIINLSVNVYLLYNTLKFSYLEFVLFVLVWVAFLRYPFLTRSHARTLTKFAAVLILAALCVDLWMGFKPFIQYHAQQVSNDYLDINEHTIVSGKTIDNARFINQLRLGGMMKQVVSEENTNRIETKFIPGFDYIPMANLSEKTQDFISHHSDKYHYSSTEHGLFVDGDISYEEVLVLCGLTDDTAQCDKIKQYASKSREAHERRYNSIEREFFNFNQFELSSQYRPGAYFHHHNAFIGAINAYNLGRPSSETIYFYGWLPTVVTAFLMNHLGGFSFSNYLTVTYSFYPLYFLLFVSLTYIIFRNLWYSAFTALATISCWYLISFEAVRMAPGFNPLRHFFDVFVIGFIFYYLVKRANNRLFLLGTAFFTIISYLTNNEFGLMLIFSVSATFAIRMFETRKLNFYEVGAIVSFGVSMLLIPLIIPTSKNLLAVYNLSGVFIPQTHLRVITSVFAIFLLVYIYRFYLVLKNNPQRYFMFFLFCYGQCSLIYFIWNPSPTHLYSIAFPWLLLICLFLQGLFPERENDFINSKAPILAFLVIFMMYFGPAHSDYFHDAKNYHAIFKTHQVYQWDMPTAHFESTMNPSVFIAATAMMDKYSKGQSVYLISKYENLLLTMSRKYNRFPYMQLDLALVTPLEVHQVVSQIFAEKPRYLFVDADIARNHHADLFNRNDPMVIPSIDFNAAHIRERMLDNLAEVFSEVKSSYRLVEKGAIISTYERI